MNRYSPIRKAAWLKGLAPLLLSLGIGCGGGEQDHPAAYRYEANPESEKESVDRCAVANDGCPCSTPGEILDCGKVVVKVDNYETCYAASRICTDAATWGPCVPDQEIVELTR